jgi:hypothetical protein
MDVFGKRTVVKAFAVEISAAVLSDSFCINWYNQVKYKQLVKFMQQKVL